MPENINKNVKILICKSCGKTHVIEKDLVNFSFTCEKCKNEIFIDESGVQIVVGNITPPETVIVNSENDNLIDEKEVDEKDTSRSKKNDISRSETNEFETNEFALI